jgi:hypothetical protein
LLDPDLGIVFFSRSLRDFASVCAASNLVEVVFLVLYLKRDHAKELVWALASNSHRVDKTEEQDAAALAAEMNACRARTHNYLFAIRLTYQALGARISMVLVSTLAGVLTMDLCDVATRFVICVLLDMVTDVVKRELCFRYSIPVHQVRDAPVGASAIINASLTATLATMSWLYVVSLRCYLLGIWSRE